MTLPVKKRLREYTTVSTAVTFSPPIAWLQVVGAGDVVLKDEAGTAVTLTGCVGGEVLSGPFSELTSMTATKVRLGDGAPPYGMTAANIPYVTDEWTDAAAVSTTALLVATATTVAAQTVLAAAMTAGGNAALLAYPRNLTFTTASTATDAPASVVITGTDINGAALSETLVLSQAATTDVGVKAFKTVTSVVYGAGVGTGGTVAIGIGGKFGLSKAIKQRIAMPNVIQERAINAIVTTGTYVSASTSPPNGTYAPSAAPDGTKDYALTYEHS